MIKRYLMLFVLLFFSVLGKDNNTNINKKIYKTKIYKVAVDPNLPPFQFLEKNKIVGLNIDLLNRIANKSGLSLEYVVMPKNKSFKELAKGNIDIILGIRFEKHNNGKLKYSENIIQSRACIIAPKNKIIELSNKNYLIGVEYNSAEYNYLKDMKNTNLNITFSQKTLFDLLVNNRVDFILGLEESLEYLLMKNEKNDFKLYTDKYSIPISYYIGFSFENTLLLNIINKELQNLKDNGEYISIHNKWMKKADKEKLKKISKHARIRFYIIIITLCILLIILFFNIQLHKMVKEKTTNLVCINKLLENKIIQLQNSIRLNSIICESSPGKIVIFDKHGKINFMNKNALSLIGEKKYLNLDFLKIKILCKIIPKNVLEKIISGEKSHITDEISINLNGKKIYFRYTIHQILDYKKNIIGGFITLEDITKEIRLKKERIKKEKNSAISNLIASMAHEIRNPLTSIEAYIEALPLQKNNEKFQKEIIKVIPMEFRRINSLIESLIDYSKQKVPCIENFSLNEVLKSSFLLINSMMKNKNIKLIKELKTNAIIPIDKHQIKQVLINIFLNAIQAIEEKRIENNKIDYYIQVKLEKKGTKIILEIKDNGIGMTKKEIENMFELFYTTKKQGSGLGLAISKDIIKANQGKIYAQSKKYEFTKLIIIFGGDDFEEKNNDYR